MEDIAKWLDCDGYTIELWDGRRIPLEDLRAAARQQRSVAPARLIVAGAKRLGAWVTWPFRRDERRGRLVPGPAATVPASRDYRTDSALGHG
jgi:hypothetical protein